MSDDLVIGWRGGPGARATPTGSASNFLNQLRGVLPKIKAEIAEHRGAPSPEAAARMERVYALSSVANLDLDVAATSLAMYRLIEAGLETLVKTWVIAKGLPFALEAVVAGVERGIVLDHESWPSSLIDGVVPFSTVTGLDQGKKAFLFEDALTTSTKAIYGLRAIAAAADDKSYAELRELGKRLAESASTAGAVAVALVLSEEAEIVDAVARRVLQQESPPAPELLLASIRDVQLGRELFAKKKILYLDDESRPAWTLIARLGPKAGPIFAAGADDDAADHLVPYLEATPSPESHRALLVFTSKKGLTKRVQKALLDRPEITLEAIAPVLADPKSKLLAAARVIASAIAKAHPELARPTSKTAPAPDAGPIAKDLPPLLASPPWVAPISKREQVAPEKIELKPMTVPIRSAVRDGDLAPLARYAEWGDEATDKERTREQWLKEIADDHKYDRAVDLDLMFRGPEDLALEEWTNASDKRRAYYPNRYYGGAFLVALQRRGPKFLPGLLALLKQRPSGASRMPIEEIGVVLLTFDGTDIAEVLVEHFDSGKKFRPVAEAWATRYPETAAKCAIPHALAGGKRAAGAIALLQSLVPKGGADAIRKVASEYERASRKPVSRALEALVGTDPLAFFPAKLPKLPDVFDPGSLPPIVLKKGGVLPAQAVTHIGTMLAFSPPDAPYAGISVVRDACTADSLRDFSWSLFEAWLAVGSPPKEMWILHALGLLGDDETARRLAPMIRAWPGERAAARAVQGLSVLANIGTDLALMLLDGIAEKVRFASIQTGARERIEQIAKARGLSREELGDRLVPDLGLDARGEMTLDYGASHGSPGRSFKVGFDEHLDPFVSEAATGKRLAALPKPGKSDDAVKAKEAQARFKALKKDVAAIARSRIDRFESAMIARRRWKAPEMKMLFIDKPLVLQLTRRLVWGAFEGNERVATFRVDADRSLADAQDKPFTLNDSAEVGIVHPIDLGEDEIAAWSRVFADYELLQPFAQLSREVLQPSAAEKKGASLTSKHDIELPAPKLVFGLEKLRWRRGGASDGGSFNDHAKTFSGTPWAAHSEYSGAVGMGYIEDKEILSIESVTFTKDGKPAKIGEVDPVIVSEVLRDLAALGN